MGMLWFDSPAQRWDQALPVGNGRLGAMVSGGTDREILRLNQDSIWYGKSVDRINPDARDHLEEVRSLILEERIPEAEELLKYTFSGTPQSQRPYQPLGTLEMTFHEMEGEVSCYRRELCLENGMVVETFDLPGKRIRKEYLASYPHGVIAVQMKAEEGCISLDALLKRGRFYDHAGKMDDSTVYMDGTLGEGGVFFLTAVRALASGGTVRVLGEQLVIREAKEVILFISCETSYYEKDPWKAVQDRLGKACEDGIVRVMLEHRQDYGRLRQVMLKISEDEGEDIPIDRRLELGREKGFDSAFAALYFQYGRYLLFSSSRPGSLPANLQGIWNEDMQPAWDSKFTVNINTEMNYWPAEVCGLSECHLPLFDHLERMRERGRETAERMYGCRGFVAHHNTDLWGDCAPQDIYIPATYWVMGGAWLCTHIWEHYLYTRDDLFLRRMYPVLKDAVLFFHDFLVEKDGRLLTCPSVSPENTYILPDGVRGCVCAGSSMDIQILKDLFHGYLKASEELGIQDENVDRTEEILEKLPEMKTGKYGQIMEWQEDYEEAEPGHRHISQLYALHPSHQITVDGTPDLAEAAEKTLKRRLSFGGGHTGWSRAWIVNLYARLGKGEEALRNLEALWSGSTFPNLMDTHPRRNGYVFQIDGNLGAAAAIAEMLVQCGEDRVLLLPALPSKWKKGRVCGLCIYGGALIDMEWEGGKLISCSVESDKEFKTTFVYRKEKRHIQYKPDMGLYRVL